MRPVDVLAAKRLLEGVIGEELDRASRKHGYDTRGNPPDASWLRDIPRDDLLDIADGRVTWEAAKHGQCYWVSPEMTDVAVAASLSLPRDEIYREDLPSLHGFLVYDKAVAEFVGDDLPAPVLIHGVAWVSAQTTDGGDGALVVMPLGVPREVVTKFVPKAPFIPLYTVRMDWHSGTTGDLTGRLEPDFANFCRLSIATWVLMQQSMTVSESQHVDRPESRRCVRAGIIPQVTVVKLRRRSTASEPDESAPVDWSHRWIVSGHWANLACGPGRSERRLTWIAPYVKGPEDKPLVIKDKVHAWVR